MNYLKIFVSFCTLLGIANSNDFVSQLSISKLFGNIPIGEPCNLSQDCKGYPESVDCQQGTCYCKDGYLIVIPEDELMCVPIRNQIGDQCVEGIQCQQGAPGELSDCYENTCNCTIAAIHQPPGHTCFLRANFLGDNCVVQAQCKANLGNFAECSTGQRKCQCNYESIPNLDNTKCLPIRDNIGDECELEEQCTIGDPGMLSDCIENQDEIPTGEKTCQCIEGAIHDPESGTHECHEIRNFIGEDCSVNAQCRLNLGDSSACLDSECDCIEDKAVANNNGTYCLSIKNLIGDICIEGQQCQVGLPGAYSDCLTSEQNEQEMTCQCTSQGIQKPGEEVCLRKAEFVGDMCSDIIQCTSNLGEHSTCTDSGLCTCIQDLSIPDGENKACLEIVNELGTSCKESQQCQKGIPGRLSECIQGFCLCSTDATNEPGENMCRPRAGYIGGACDLNSQCKANLGNLSECLGQVCVCTPSHGIPSLDRFQCLPIVNFLGNDCLEPQQCREGVPGEHSDCILSTTDSSLKVCNCSLDSIHQPGKNVCYKKADTIGAPCIVNEQCIGNLGEFSVCSLLACTCAPNLAIPNKDNNICLAIINEIGIPCEENEQCQQGAPGDLSECRRSNTFPYQTVCNCSDEAMTHPGRQTCYRKATAVGDSCQFNAQCEVNLGSLSNCNLDTNKCQCIPGAVANTENNQCITGGIFIGRPCYDSEQCVGEPSVTSICNLAKICDCLSGHTASSTLNNCLPIRHEIGESCVEKQQCQEGQPGYHSDCMSSTTSPTVNVCNCTIEAITEAGQHKCHLKATHVGSPCLVNVQCVANLDYSHCLEGTCHCLTNTTASSNNTKCLMKAYLDQPCIDDNQCTHMDYSECRDQQCQCTISHIPNPLLNNTCILLAQYINESCKQHPTQCQLLHNSFCNSNSELCQCEHDVSVISNDRKKCLVAVHELHEQCEENVQCQTKDSTCLQHSSVPDSLTCQCRPNDYVESESPRGFCLPICHQIGETCQETVQCSSGIGSHTECILGYCRCSYPYVHYQGKCIVPARLGGICFSDEECHAGVNNITMCKQVCVCRDTAFQVADSCWDSKVVGDSCLQDVECTMTIIGPVECSSLICSCQQGYSPDTGGIRCSSGYKIRLYSYLLVIILFTHYMNLK